MSNQDHMPVYNRLGFKIGYVKMSGGDYGFYWALGRLIGSIIANFIILSLNILILLFTLAFTGGKVARIVSISILALILVVTIIVLVSPH